MVQRTFVVVALVVALYADALPHDQIVDEFSETKPTVFVDTEDQAGTLAGSRAQMQARAKAEYDTAMAKMQKLSDKLGKMSEDYEARAEEEGEASRREGRKERLEVAATLVDHVP
jgi:predicted Zn-dependent protease